MLLHTLPKYHNLRPVAEGSKFTCFWSHPCLTFSDVIDHSHKRAPVAGGHSGSGPSVSHSRGWWGKGFRVRGQRNATCSVVCHMAWPSWMTVDGFESQAQSPLTAHHLVMDVIHSGYQFPLMRTVCDLGGDPNWLVFRCHVAVQQCNKNQPLTIP